MSGHVPESVPEIVVVVRDAGMTWLRGYVEPIRQAGCRVGVVTRPMNPATAQQLESLADRFAVVDNPTDPGQVAAAARELAEGCRLGAVFSAEDAAIVPAAEAAELLGVGRAPAGALASARNKFAARQAMRSAGLPVPRYALLRSESEVLAVTERVGLPAVVKPINGSGSHLVRRVTSVAELAEAYRVMVARMPAAAVARLYAKPLDCGEAGTVDPMSTFLVESLLRGREYCVDLVVRNGEIEQVALLDKCLIDERFFECGFVVPPFDLEPGRERPIRTAVDDSVRALGLDNTVACIEVIDDETLGPTIVEINAGRPGGQLLPILYELVTGINTSAELVAANRGVQALRTEPRLTIPTATLTVFAEGSGRLRALHGLAEVELLPDVLEVIPLVRNGDVIEEDCETFAVNLLVAGFLDADDLRETYEQARKLVRLELEPI